MSAPKVKLEIMQPNS